MADGFKPLYELMPRVGDLLEPEFNSQKFSKTKRVGAERLYLVVGVDVFHTSDPAFHVLVDGKVLVLFAVKSRIVARLEDAE